MIFALKPKSPQNQEDYVTEALSGRLRLFQKEFISSPMTKNNETKVISTKASAIKTCWNYSFNVYSCALSSISIQVLKDVHHIMGEDVNLHLMESFQDENDTSVDTDLQTLRVIVSWIQNNSTTGNL